MTSSPAGTAAETTAGTAAQETAGTAAEARHRDLVEKAMALARVFAGGGRLAVTAPGRQDHARHVAVEFVHPAITGARALPATAVSADDLPDAVGRDDAALIIEEPTGGGEIADPPAGLTMRIGGPVQPLAGSDLVRWYHLLWELVQLSFEHPDVAGRTGAEGGDSTNFLYPFLDPAEPEATASHESALLSTLTASAQSKFAASQELTSRSAERNRGPLDRAATDITARLRSGGTVLAIGNGGSACDAARLVRLLKARGRRAICLSDDPAVLTALANDLGADMIFSRQAEAALRPADVLVAFSTSGSSPNLLAALDVPLAETASVVAVAGYDGGPLCRHRNVDHRLIVESSSVHRIQEAQARLIDLLCEKLDS